MNTAILQPPPPTSQSPTKVRWQRPESGSQEDRAAALLAETDSLFQLLSADVTRTLAIASALSGRSRLPYRMPIQARLTPATELDLGPDQRDENLLYEMYDAMMSSAASSPLIPVPQGRGALFRLARAMRHAGRWLEAAWEDLKAESACLDMIGDAFQHGWGAIRVRYDKHAEQIALDPVRFDSLVIDQAEAAMGPVQTLRLYHKLQPGVLADMYDLEEQKGEDDKPLPGVMAEAWRLPSAGRPGRHMLVVGSGTNQRVLVDEEWSETLFPVVIFHWRRLRMGFYDAGGAEQILPYHNQLLNLNRRIRQSLILCITPRLLAHVSAQLQVSNLDSEAGRVYTHKGSAPVPFVWPTNLTDMLAERERTKNRAYESFGASQMTSTQALPTAMRADSSAAIREIKLMEDQRHLDRWTRFQDARMQLAKVMLFVQGKYGKDKEVRYLRGRAARWDKAAPLLDQKNQALWSLKPLPATAHSLAANRATIEEMTANGLLTDEDRKYLAGHPDPEIILARARARVDDIDRTVESLEDGEYVAPSKDQDLSYGQYAVNAALLTLRGSEDRADHADVEEYMVTWINQAQNILDTEAAAQAMAQQADGDAGTRTTSASGRASGRLGHGPNPRSKMSDKSKTPTLEEMQAQLAELQATNAKLAKAAELRAAQDAARKALSGHKNPWLTRALAKDRDAVQAALDAKVEAGAKDPVEALAAEYESVAALLGASLEVPKPTDAAPAPAALAGATPPSAPEPQTQTYGGPVSADLWQETLALRAKHGIA